MFANHVPASGLRGRRPRQPSGYPTNVQVAVAAWGEPLPVWVRLLAIACDQSSQREVGDRLGKSSGYISRLINNKYPGDLAEAELLVRASYAADEVHCPIWNAAIPLRACISNRRRTRRPQNFAQVKYEQICPTCPHNSDGPAATGGEA